MRDWDRIFMSIAKSGLYAVSDTAEVDRARQAAQASGLEVFDIDLSRVMDKAGFLRAVAESLQFPGYFGMNWDAFEECLIDLVWLPARGYVLFMTYVGNFTEFEPHEMKTARSIFKRAVAHWKKQGTPFFVVLSE